MPPLKYKPGYKLGKLQIKSLVKKGNRYTQYVCICDCGNEISVSAIHFRRKKKKDCGCETLSKHKKEYHGQAPDHNGKNASKPYRTWAGMKKRCYNKNEKNYKNYGGRGIGVCDRWLNSFCNFYEDMGDPPSPNHSIERINNNGDYEPNNCKWAELKEQSRNKRTNRYLTFNNQTKVIIDWAKETGITRETIAYRIKHGWSVEKTLTTPIKPKHYLTFNNQTKTISEWAKEINLNTQTLSNRINRYGWSVERALTTPLLEDYIRNTKSKKTKDQIAR